MSIFSILALGLVMGIVFGFALEKTRTFDPEIIIGQFQFRKFTMLKVFLTAIITGLIIFSFFFSLGFERLNWKVSIYAGDIVGGLLLGIGIAFSGGCPGTLFAQIGAGYKDALVTLAGGVLGAVTFILLKPWLETTLLSMPPQERLTLDGILDWPFTTAALLLMLIFGALLFILEWYRPWKEDMRGV